jgi:lipopolysaccharide/colanic/teichoic acid biosynthesis glycosyltransferase
MDSMKRRKCGLIVKCIFDKVFSIFSLIVLLPLLVLIAAAIKLDSKGPVLFIQERMGQYGKAFNIYKFRTMVVNAQEMGDRINVSENDWRITKVGAFLRRFSLDELPQLINIIKNDMSLIGPRPTLKCQVDRYNDFEKRRLEAKPGVTSLPAVYGRNSLPWPERIGLDVWYIDNWSLWLDTKIFFETIKVVISGKGLYGNNETAFHYEKEEL